MSRENNFFYNEGGDVMKYLTVLKTTVLEGLRVYHERQCRNFVAKATDFTRKKQFGLSAYYVKRADKHKLKEHVLRDIIDGPRM